MIDIDELANEIRTVDGGNKLGAGALAEKLSPFIERHAKELEETAMHNYETMDIVFGYLLEMGLIHGSDIGDDDTPESAAQVFIRVYEKLQGK